MAYVRTVKTSSGATAVPVCTPHGRVRARSSTSARRIPPRRSRRSGVAAQRLAQGQAELDLGLEVAAAAAGGPLEITPSRMGHLWDALGRAYDALGFDEAAGGDEVFRQLVLARIIEPTSKEDSVRVLEEAGARRQRRTARSSGVCRSTAEETWRTAVGGRVRAACRAGAGQLVLYDVTTLYFETHEGDGFREPGFSNYAEVLIMPRSSCAWWCSRWSAGWGGAASAA